MADADLVLEGGGVKGTGLAGAITALAAAAEPYTFHRVAGTSAGAIVASMLAAGYDAAAMKTVMSFKPPVCCDLMLLSLLSMCFLSFVRLVVVDVGS